jgi:predicted PurR-regulated permease PerM
MNDPSASVMPPVTTFDSRRHRAQLVVAALGAAIGFAVLPLAVGLLGAIVIYVAAAPAYHWLARRVPARVSALLVVVVAATLIILPLGWLITVAIAQAPSAIRQVQHSEVIAQIAALRIGSIDVGAQLVEAGGGLAAWASAQAFRAVGSVVRATVNMVVALFGLYFLLLAGPATWASVSSYLPFSDAGVRLLAERFREVTEATLLGTAMTAALQGTVVALGFVVTGLPDAWFWGVVTGAVSILPLLGSALVWGSGAAALALQGRYDAAVGLAAIGFIVASNIDNVTRPLVNQRLSHLHPMTTLVGAFAGVGVLGLPGILFGPLAISYFFELVRLYAREYGKPPVSDEVAVSDRGVPETA